MTTLPQTNRATTTRSWIRWKYTTKEQQEAIIDFNNGLHLSETKLVQELYDVEAELEQELKDDIRNGIGYTNDKT
eukprot:6471618-Amphidinium_carterae.1